MEARGYCGISAGKEHSETTVKVRNRKETEDEGSRVVGISRWKDSWLKTLERREWDVHSCSDGGGTAL